MYRSDAEVKPPCRELQRRDGKLVAPTSLRLQKPGDLDGKEGRSG